MTYKELLDKVYNDIGHLALDLYRSGRAMTQDELINWMNKQHPDLPSQYKGLQGVLQASFDRADDEDTKNAIRTVFFDKHSNSVW